MIEEGLPGFSTGFAQLVWKRYFPRKRTLKTLSSKGIAHP